MNNTITTDNISYYNFNEHSANGNYEGKFDPADKTIIMNSEDNSIMSKNKFEEIVKCFGDMLAINDCLSTKVEERFILSTMTERYPFVFGECKTLFACYSICINFFKSNQLQEFIFPYEFNRELLDNVLNKTCNLSRF